MLAINAFTRHSNGCNMQDRKAKGKGKKGKHGKGRAQSPSPQESQAEGTANATPPNDQSAPQNYVGMT